MPQQIGLFGGTFDPPHRGHVAAASSVRATLGLDSVVLMVANDPWHKETGSQSVSPAGVRLEMTQVAVAGVEGLEAGAEEIVRGGPTYTIDTVVEMLRVRPRTRIWVIVGADSASQISSWRDYRKLAASATMVAVTRPGHPLRDRSGVHWQVVEIEPVDVSSTEIRRRIAAGESGADVAAEGWLSPAVAGIIDREHLYRAEAAS